MDLILSEEQHSDPAVRQTRRLQVGVRGATLTTIVRTRPKELSRPKNDKYC